jgi:hypothetical protein
MKLDEEKLIRMTVDEARDAKWALGARKYGLMFMGNPAVKLHSEAIDCLNYTAEMESQELGSPDELDDIRWSANRIIRITRDIYAKQATLEARLDKEDLDE